MNRANNINPGMLRWARETAGLDLHEAVGKLNFIRPSGDVTAAERLLAFEAGSQRPTRNQLQTFASVYRRPPLVFYMKRPPKTGSRGEDFRRTSGSVSRRENSLLDALLRDIRARQEMVKSLLEEQDEANDLAFAGSAAMTQRPESVASSIAETLDFDCKNPDKRDKHADGLFKTLRTKAESSGVFVMLIGDLGSHHTALDADVFRSFAISDHIAPFVVINDRTARPARPFTLMHELAHIWLNQSGVSGPPSLDTPHSSHERIERFCNDVAGEFLLPATSLLAHNARPDPGDKESVARFIEDVAKQWSVSETLVAYRLNRIDFVNNSIYRELVADYAVRWQCQRQREQFRNSDGFLDPNVIKRYKLGNTLLDVVCRTLRNESLTHTKAAKLLGVKPGAVESFLRGYENNHSSMIQGTT